MRQGVARMLALLTESARVAFPKGIGYVASRQEGGFAPLECRIFAASPGVAAGTRQLEAGSLSRRLHLVAAAPRGGGPALGLVGRTDARRAL